MTDANNKALLATLQRVEKIVRAGILSSGIALLIALTLTPCNVAAGEGLSPWGQGHADYQTKRYGDAITAFKQVLRRPSVGSMDEQHVDAAIFIGLANYRLGRFEASRDAFVRATRMYEPASYPSAGFRAWTSGKHEQAAKIYRSLILEGGADSLGINVNDTGAREPLMKALSDLANGSPEHAATEAATSVRLYPGFKTGLFVLGLSKLALGKREASRDAFLDALDSSVSVSPESYLTDPGFAGFDAMAMLLRYFPKGS